MPLKHSIPLATAVEMTKRLRENRNTILAEQYQRQDIVAICETFDADSIQAILTQDGCVSLRIYYGMDESLKMHAILVGADINGKDILPPQADAAANSPIGEIMEDGLRCPTMCPPPSPLNEP
jgi:hypothetical protein